MGSRQTVIYDATSLEHALLLRQFLEQRGIPAKVGHDSFGEKVGDHPEDNSTPPCVTVADENAEEARRIARLFDRYLPTHRGRSLAASDRVSNHPEGWPECPQCQQLRQVVCPSCSEAGYHFSLADIPVIAAEAAQAHDSSSRVPPPSDTTRGADNLPLLCPLCDEVFLARYYRHCERCGHDFGRGVEEAVNKMATISARERAVMLLLAGTTIGIVGYLAWLYC